MVEGSPLAVADDLAIDSSAFLWAVDKIKPQPDNTIYFSSSAAYPIKLRGSSSAEDITNLSDLTYGWAKLTGEYLALLAHQKYGLNVSIYRPTSGYGEDQHEAYPFTSLIKKAVRKDNPIYILSNAIRDFMYIEDFVSCVLKTYHKIQGQDPVNLGSGIGMSFTDLAKKMAKIVGYDAQVMIQKQMPLGVQYRVGNTSLLQRLGCKAETPIEMGIKKSIRYHMRESQISSSASHSKNNDRKYNQTSMYSSIQCIAGNHKIDKGKYFGKHITDAFKFPLLDPKFRTCKVRNVCWEKGQLIYYEHPTLKHNVDRDFLMEDINSEGFYAGQWSPEPFYFAVKNTSVPQHVPFDRSRIAYLDAHSNSYNYGHYILDNVFPHFVAAKLFDVDFTAGRQVFESSCKHFGSMPEKVAHYAVPFNSSLGTYRTACLEKMNMLWPFFFEKEPLYLEPVYTNSVCFDTILVGQGSTFGLKSADPSKGVSMREFRDFVVKRVSTVGLIPTQIDQILVGERSAGHSGGEKVEDLCQRVTAVVDLLNAQSANPFSVKCIVNQDVSFIEEVQAVQQSKILISVHGTISYMSLFARDNTQIIVLADNNDPRLKEHNVLMYATHFTCRYLMWDKFDSIDGLILLAISDIVGNSNGGPRWNNLKNAHATKLSNSKVDLSKVRTPYQSMRPAEGTLIKSPATGGAIYLVTNGTRCCFSSRAVFQSRGYDFSDVFLIADYEMLDIPTGPDLN